MISKPNKPLRKKAKIENGYETGKHGLIFWTTDLRLFHEMKKWILKL